ncbi:MAG: type II secretion system protein GspG [Planctomycetota bacterium]
MHHRRNARRRMARSGFSLLELTLVLVILGVLGAVAAVNVLGQGDRAKETATKATMQTIKSQIDAFQLNESRKPTNLQELVTAKYLESGRIKDGWGRELIYLADGTGENPYELQSAGPDGEFGTGDEINVWTMNQE